MSKALSLIRFLTFLSMSTHGQALENIKDIDEYDQICADHMVMVFHAYDQQFSQKNIDFKESIHISAQFMKIFPYELRRDPVHEDLLDGWIFRPFYGKTGIKFYSLDWQEQSLMGMIAYHESRKILTITYRGTQQFSDMWDNLNFFRRMSDHIPDKILFHSGYLNIFENSLPSLTQELKDLTIAIDEKDQKDLTVLITGYSLGGATASISSLYLRQYFPEASMRLSVFGAPCVGSIDFNEKLEYHKIKAKSFVRKTDYTPFNPSCYGLKYTGKYIELPDYGDWSLAWPMAHDCRKYQRAIYEYLKQEDRYKSLFSINIAWLTSHQF